MQKTKQAVSQQDDSTTHMPAFNRVITVEVDMDMMLNKLLGLLPEDYKHREVLAHAVIGSAVEAGNINYIYNALNGYDNNIDFKVGDIVMCSEPDRRERYDANLEGEDGLVYAEPKNQTVEPSDYKPNWKTRKVAIGKCEIVEINLYAKDKLKVKYKDANSYNDSLEITTSNVNHKNCSFVPEPEPVSH